MARRGDSPMRVRELRSRAMLDRRLLPARTGGLSIALQAPPVAEVVLPEVCVGRWGGKRIGDEYRARHGN